MYKLSRQLFVTLNARCVWLLTGKGRFSFLLWIIFGVGEPLMNPELFDIIRFAKNRNIRIGFTTNGMLLAKNNIENILDSKPDWVNISIDGATKKTYEDIRVGADFDLVIANVKELARGVKNTGIDVSIWFLGMRDNIEELPLMVKLVSGLGVKHLNMQSVHNWGKKEWEERLGTQRINSDSAKLKDAVLKTKRLAKESDICFNYVNIPFKRPKRTCQWPWKSCYITADGFVTPCCIHGSDPAVINFGNIFEKSFAEIWNSLDYREFRRMLKSDKLPQICNGCTSYGNKLNVIK
jgi:radical SAM protein with 4Fe4S-binding SPASM domain